MGLKTHTKIALVVRQEADGLRCYAHIGTGNYHVKTARLYTDLGLLTCDPVITTDIVNLFHYLTSRSRKPKFSRLLVAPFNMRERFLEMVEAGAAYLYSDNREMEEMPWLKPYLQHQSFERGSFRVYRINK